MDTTLINWPSPAKLNLFLHINERMANGYHHLQSVFQLLDYGDTLRFDTNDSGKLHLANPIEGVANADNLVLKAAVLLQQHCQCTQGATIYLHKKMPMGGGLGGGSSNAATVLLALNYLWKCNLPLTELAALGLSLGADVPIFIQGKSAFSEGVGELIQPMELPEQTYLVINPDCHISTADIFNHPQLPRATPRINKQQYSFQTTVNDCQNLVFSLQPKVAKALQWLIEYAPSRMTGTGACVFAVFDDENTALACLEQLPTEFSGFVARGVNTSGVHELLATLQHHE
ncbi:4-(cytidine 5'-diphospho)-2-C-methyl-D-erythritol kinase [Alteromonadaceae bacterium BrNp21-10]|nr:4-(cytidine 5'-diphospho)-2-C-methyl-D-erythritol kinase [Alteromonadaceae bacterium BrNp21-10]